LCVHCDEIIDIQRDDYVVVNKTSDDGELRREEDFLF
jgi:hypothetical protein